VFKSFWSIVDDVKRKPYDLLDFTRNTFDRDFLEFNVNIHDLEISLQVRGVPVSVWCASNGRAAAADACAICGAPTTLPVTRHSLSNVHGCTWPQAFVNSSFEHISSTHHALSLLAQFKAILHRNSLKQELESKVQVCASK
jgi:dynein heavy chain